MPTHTGWSLSDATLSPTIQHLQHYTIALLNTPLPDPVLALRFPDGSLPFHKSYLRAASPPLRALITGPFVEAAREMVVLSYESCAVFAVIRRFLYRLPIDMPAAPVELPLVADRWGLRTLFRACLAFVVGHSWNGVEGFLNAVIPILQIPRLPARFKTAVIVKLANDLHDIQSWMSGSEDVDANRGDGEAGFRETVLWQALLRQRMIPGLVKYLKSCRTNTYDYTRFVIHGVHHVLAGVISEQLVWRVMFDVSCNIPRVLRTYEDLLCARSMYKTGMGIKVLPMYIGVGDEVPLDAGEGFCGLFGLQALTGKDVDCGKDVEDFECGD